MAAASLSTAVDKSKPTITDSLVGSSRPELGFLAVLAVPLIASLASFKDIELAGVNYLAVLTLGLPLAVAVLLIVKAGLAPQRIRFWAGHRVWLVWYAIVWSSILWTEASKSEALKFAFELSTPYIFGLAGALFIQNQQQLKCLLIAFLLAVVSAFGAIVAWKVGLIDLGSFSSGAAIDARPHSMSLIPVAAIAIAFFPQRVLIAASVWGACLLISALEGSRGATMCMLVLPLFHPIYKGILWRVFAVVFLTAMAFAVFSLPAMQSRLFPQTGSGTLTELLTSKSTGTGRFDAWPLILEKAWERPLAGHGVASAFDYVPTIWNRMDSPHNELLRVGYEFGWLGLIALGTAFVVQLWYLKRSIRDGSSVQRIAFGAVYLSLIGFLMMGTTDNPVSSNIRYLNPVFVVLGAALAVGQGAATKSKDAHELEAKDD